MATTLTKQIVAVPAQVPAVAFTVPVGTRIIGVDVLNLDGVAPQLGVAGNYGGWSVHHILDLYGNW